MTESIKFPLPSPSAPCSAGAASSNAFPTRFQVRSKIWLEMDGEPVFGQGRERLLRLVQKTASINAAAKEMGITYRKAWTSIDAMEKRLGFPLVTRLKGGAGGGSSTLTVKAEELLQKYDLLQQGFNEMVNSKFAELEF